MSKQLNDVMREWARATLALNEAVEAMAVAEAQVDAAKERERLADVAVRRFKVGMMRAIRGASQ